MPLIFLHSTNYFTSIIYPFFEHILLDLTIYFNFLILTLCSFSDYNVWVKVFSFNFPKNDFFCVVFLLCLLQLSQLLESLTVQMEYILKIEQYTKTDGHYPKLGKYFFLALETKIRWKLFLKKCYFAMFWGQNAIWNSKRENSTFFGRWNETLFIMYF